MIVSIIAAMDENRGIGYQGKIPWRISSDLKRFKKITSNHHILMGRKTFQSIGKPLPNRVNLVISRNREFSAPGCFVFNSMDLAIEFAKNAGETDLFIIGGAELYKMTIEIADRMYITKVLTKCEVDTKFPKINENDWDLKEKQFFSADERDDFATIFFYYKKKISSNF